MSVRSALLLIGNNAVLHIVADLFSVRIAIRGIILGNSMVGAMEEDVWFEKSTVAKFL